MSGSRRKKSRIPQNSSLSRSDFLPFYSLLIASFTTGLFAFFYFFFFKNEGKCQAINIEKMTLLLPKEENVKLSKNQSYCYEFQVKENQQIGINSSHNVNLEGPNDQIETFQGNSKTLQVPGVYKVKIPKTQENFIYYVMVLTVLKNDQVSSHKSPSSPSMLEGYPRPLPTASSSPLTPPLPPSYQKTPLAYNVQLPGEFFTDLSLQKIVDDIVVLARRRGLPTRALSISLIDLNRSQCCGYAGYQSDELRYPASVVKLFWLVAFYARKYHEGLSPQGITPEDQKLLLKMVGDSDNESASAIVDKITDTESTRELLSKEKFKRWKAQRDEINHFFEVAGYENINVSQKTFPIPRLSINPQGPDLQLRQINGKNSPPMRNKVSTKHVARLLYEIVTSQTISSEYSQAILQLIFRDLQPESWKEKPYNSIEEFFGEGIYQLFPSDPNRVQVYSKMGWTFNNRNDAAIISSANNRYILVVFGDDPKYYEDKKFFPILSQEVYRQMLKLSRK